MREQANQSDMCLFTWASNSLHVIITISKFQATGRRHVSVARCRKEFHTWIYVRLGEGSEGFGGLWGVKRRQFRLVKVPSMYEWIGWLIISSN